MSTTLRRLSTFAWLMLSVWMVIRLISSPSSVTMASIASPKMKLPDTRANMRKPGSSLSPETMSQACSKRSFCPMDS